jgi:3-isopropylmalate/(R)-2-methylmalate dehydratase large subunit
VGSDHAIEFSGDLVQQLPMEARLTLCNLTVELGAKTGVIAPDAATLAWCAERLPADQLIALTEYCNSLVTDAGARFDSEHQFDASMIAPQVTWGTSPQHSIGIDDPIPDPGAAPDGQTAAAWRSALDYQGLRPGWSLLDLPIDHVFIGSCTNSRLSDLRAAAAIARTGRVAPGVEAWVVPGSMAVARAAEGEGLDRVFKQAGFEWRLPGCSRCVAMNGETIAAGARCLSTSNRDFVGRQGPGARTHLASPATAAASALAGRFADPRVFGELT